MQKSFGGGILDILKNFPWNKQETALLWLQAFCRSWGISFITDNPTETQSAQKAWQYFQQLVAHSTTQHCLTIYGKDSPGMQPKQKK